MRLLSASVSVPHQWSLLRLDEAGEFCNSLRVPLNDEYRRSRQGPYPYYGPTGIVDWLDEYRADGVYTLLGEDGDHFLKWSSWPMTHLVKGRFTVNNHAHLIRGTDKCTTEWIHQFFFHRDLRRVLTLQGVGRLKLTREAAGKLLILVPPVREQTLITDILGSYDSGVQVVAALLKARRRLKRGLLQALLSGERRFPEFRNQPWVERRINEFLTESRDIGSNGAAAQKLSIRLYGKGVYTRAERRTGSAETQYYRRRSGQLVYSKLDFLNGAFGIVPPGLNGFESTLDVPAFDIAVDIDSRWLLYFLTREGFYTRQLGIAHGGRKARRVNPDDFLSLKITMPNKSEQTRIADALAACDHELDLLRALQGTLKDQKRVSCRSS